MFARPNIEALQKIVAESKAAGGGGNRRNFRAELGTSKVLICPPYNGRGLFSKAVYVHFNVPGENGKNTTIIDPTLTFGREDIPNPVGKAVSLVLSVGKEEAKKFKSKARSAVNVIPIEINGEPADRGKYPYLPHIMDGPILFHNFISQKAADPEFWGDDGPVFANPNKVQVLKISRTGAGVNTEYDLSFPPKMIPFAPDEATLKAIADNIYDLDKVYTWSKKSHDRSVKIANKILMSLGFEAQAEDWYGTLPADLLTTASSGTESEDEEEGKA